MDLSFLGQSSKQLVSSQCEDHKENQPYYNFINSSNKKAEDSCPNLLLESIKYKESERSKIKMQREISAKEDQIAQLIERCQRFQRSEQKAKNKVACFERENKALKHKVQLLQKEIDEKVNQSKEQITTLKLEKRQLQETNKQAIRSLQLQNQQLKNNLKSQSQAHQIAIKRLQLQNEQISKSLSAKISIKEKQLSKVEAVLQSKKYQLNVLLAEKELEIESLQQSRNQFEQEINALTLNLKQYQQEISLLHQRTKELQVAYQSDLCSWRAEMERTTLAYQNDKEFFKVTFDCIEQALKALMRQFSLKQPQCRQLHERLDDFREQLRQKYKQSKDKQQFNRIYGQVQRYRNLQLQLRNKVNLLQEQLDFTKLNYNKNQNVAQLVKEHLDNHQQTLIDYRNDKIKNYNSQKKNPFQIKTPTIQNKHLQQQIQSLISQTKQIHQIQNRKARHSSSNGLRVHRNNNHMKQQSQNRPNIDKSHSKTINRIDPTKSRRQDTQKQNLISYSLQSKLGTSQQQPLSQIDKTQFNILKNELTSKKKSLIYLMFKRDQQPQPPLPVQPMRQQITQKRYKNKQRSCSMGELVRRRCQEHI